MTNPNETAASLQDGPPGTAPASAAQTRLTLLAYGGLSLPVWLAELPILTYLPAFYARELRLSAGLIGLVFLCVRVWDALCSIFIGWMSDRSMSRWGRRKPWVIGATPFLMASVWFLCNPPSDISWLYLAFWALLFYSAWGALFIPYLSWGTELASGYVERNRVTSYRETCTTLANLFFAAAPLVLLAGDAPLREVLGLISMTSLLLMPVMILPLALRVTDPMPMQRMQTHPLKELNGLARDRVLVRFVIATLVFFIGEGLVNSLLVFFFSVGLQLSDKIFWAIFILYISTLSAVPLMLRVARRTEKHQLLAAAVVIQVLLYGAFSFVPQGHFAAVVVLEILLGFANSALVILPTSMLADLIDHGEVANGERRSGAYAAVYNLSRKLGIALGVGLAFGLLALVNYDPGAASHSATDAIHIRWLTFGLPCLLQIPAIFLYLRHPITREVHARLRERIELREAT